MEGQCGVYTDEGTDEKPPHWTERELFSADPLRVYLRNTPPPLPLPLAFVKPQRVGLHMSPC